MFKRILSNKTTKWKFPGYCPYHIVLESAFVYFLWKSVGLQRQNTVLQHFVRIAQRADRNPLVTVGKKGYTIENLVLTVTGKDSEGDDNNEGK